MFVNKTIKYIVAYSQFLEKIILEDFFKHEKMSLMCFSVSHIFW